MAFGVLVCVGPEQDLKWLPCFTSVNGQAIRCSFLVVCTVWLHLDQEEEIPATAVENPMVSSEGSLGVTTAGTVRGAAARHRRVLSNLPHPAGAFSLDGSGLPSIVRTVRGGGVSQ